MRIREIFEQRLVEQQLADLYHGTSLMGAQKILNTNVIKANMPVHSDLVPAQVKGQGKTVSLTRNLNIARKFAKDKQYVRGDHAAVIFVIDQDRLKQDLGKRVRPYDDTSTDWFRKQADITSTRSLRPTYRAELEEVVYGDIDNASRYIKHIVVMAKDQEHVDQIKQQQMLVDPRVVYDTGVNTPGERRKDSSSRHYRNRLGIGHTPVVKQKGTQRDQADQRFAEARKNPEKNPKTAINDIIIAATDKTTDRIKNTKNLFVSFTHVDKLGLNPRSTYNTPIGVYAYPAEYVVAITGSDKRMTALPFAGEQPYVNLFSFNGDIINVATMTSGAAAKYMQRVQQLWADVSGKKTAANDTYALVRQASLQAKFPDLPGGRFWYVTMTAATELFAPFWNTPPHIAWTRIFRAIGIDGAIDYDPGLTKLGVGIIHENEPCQAVFFSTTGIQNAKRYDNKYSPDEGKRDLAQIAGQQRHDTISQISAKLRSMSSPEEVFDYLKNELKSTEHLKLVKDPTAREYVLSRLPLAVGRLSNPTARDQLAALTSNFDAIKYIKQPDESAVLKALQANPYAEVDWSDLADRMPYAGEQFQQLAVSKQPMSIVRFTKPAPSAIITALKNISDPSDWILKIAARAGVDYRKYLNLENFPAIKTMQRELELIKEEQQRTKDKIIATQKELKEFLHLYGNNSTPEAVATVKAHYGAIVKQHQAKLAQLEQKAEDVVDDIEQTKQQLMTLSTK